MKRIKSFRSKILFIFMVGYFSIIGALLVYAYSVNLSYKQSMKQTGNAMLNLYVSELDDLLRINSSFLLQIISQNFNSIVLQSSDTDVKKYSAAYDLNQALDNQLTLEKGIAGFVILYDGGDTCFYTYQKTVAFDEKNEIRNYINKGIKTEGFLKHWRIVRCENKPYMVLTYGVKKTYMSIVIDFEAVTSEIVNKYASNTTKIVFHDNKGILNNQDFTQDIGFTVEKEGTGSISKHSNYLFFSKKIKNTELAVTIFVPAGSVFTMQWSQIFILCILLLAFGCACISYFYLHKELIGPIKQMTATMERIMDGQIDAKMPESTGIAEYEQTGRVFNSMMDQIKELRIKTYEEEIKEQKERLQYLQLQIKPHFYLNCLKTLYALVQQQKFKKLENTIIEISKYFRYTFKDTFKPVTVREELDFTKDYLNLQIASTGMDLAYEIETDDEVMDMEVLPLTVQTFVENSVKYACVEGQLRIGIQVHCLKGEEGDYLDLVVSDNGQGYEEEWLEKMNQKDYDCQAEEHVGILNLKRRMQLQYGEAAEFAVRNHYGAISEVILPVKRQQA